MTERDESMGKEPLWQRTQVKGLLRNRNSGTYYGRWKVAGKQKWVCLKTDVFSVAKLRHREHAAQVDRQRAAAAQAGAPLASMAAVMAEYERLTSANTDLRPGSVAARLQAVKKIRQTWPQLETLRPDQVTAEAVQEWASRFKSTGTGFVPPGANSGSLGNSASSVNKAVDTLRRLFDLAVASGSSLSNPARVRPANGDRLKKKVTPKRLELPAPADLLRVFDAMQSNGAVGGWGIEAADFCRFLLFSGCRVGEAGVFTWECVDWHKRLARVPGFKTATSDRIIPLFPDLEQLLRSIETRRRAAARFSLDGKPMLEASDRVFRISECQKSIDAACAKTCARRFTHHDLRHAFATACIESGVDIPTVSRWLGHADGGALAMKTYGHLRQEHSQLQATKVSFRPQEVARA